MAWPTAGIARTTPLPGAEHMTTTSRTIMADGRDVVHLDDSRSSRTRTFKCCESVTAGTTLGDERCASPVSPNGAPFNGPSSAVVSTSSP